MNRPIKDRWQRGKLGDLLPLKYGKGLPEKSRDSSGQVPVFGSSGQVGRHSHPLTRGPTLIVGRKGTVGAVHLSNEPCWPIDTVYFAEAEKVQNLKYYKYLLDSLNLVRLDRSTAVPGLSRDDYNAVEVTIAPPREQERIVAEIEKQFSRLDDAVANLKRVKANLKRYKTAVLKAAVEGSLVPTEAQLAGRQRRSYETGDQLFERITATVARSARAAKKAQPPSESGRSLSFELPDGWSVAPIAHLAEVVDYGSSAKTSEADVGVPVLRMGNIVDGDLDLGTLKYLPDSHGEFPRLLLRPGDLLFNRTNSPELVGKTAVFNGRPEKCSFASYLIRVRLTSGCIPEFVSGFINSVHGRNWVKTVVTQQVGQANVNGTKLRNLLIPLPPIVEQERIVSELGRRLSLVGHVEASIDAELKLVAILRQAALQSHFTHL